MSSKTRTVSIELTSNDALTRMYANDILEAKMVYEKVNKVADPEFGKEALQDFYELL